MVDCGVPSGLRGGIRRKQNQKITTGVALPRLQEVTKVLYTKYDTSYDTIVFSSYLGYSVGWYELCVFL